MRLVLTVLTFLASLAAVAVLAFFVVIFLAGPHSGLLPQPLEVTVIVLGWVCMIAVPVWLAHAVWRRGGAFVRSDRDA